MVIAPKVYVTPDRPFIRIREPEEKVNLDREIQKVLSAQGWGLGIYFNVQFVSHDETELLSQYLYVVSKDKEEFKTNDDEYNPASKTVHVKEATLIGGSDKALPAIVSGLDGLENKITVILEDSASRNDQVADLSNRVIDLEKRPKRGRPVQKEDS